MGNHDASGPDEPTQWWFKKWIDPMGENTAHSGVDPKRRPYPITGTWERYTFRVGNMVFLMMGDRNDGGPPVGRAKRGGYPSGAVTGETFEWWKQRVATNQGSIIVSAHHHMLKETTVASGPWEGYIKDAAGNWKAHYHGYFPDGGPEGASYLYWVDGKPDAQAFEGYLAKHPGAIDLWLGGHTHTNPEDRKGGRSHIEKKWGTQFMNVSALSRHHGGVTGIALSRLMTFTEGSDEVLIQCYLHTSDLPRKAGINPPSDGSVWAGPFNCNRATSMLRLLRSVIVCWILQAVSSIAAPLELVVEGEPRATIVLADQPSAAAQEGAALLVAQIRTHLGRHARGRERRGLERR